jgi:hypothetical protein
MAAIGRSSGSTSDTAATASRVCIIDEALARRYFGSTNPVGRHLSRSSRYSAEHAMEIIGVVKDAHHASVKRADSYGMLYQTSWSNGPEVRWLEVRAAQETAAVIAAIRRELRSLDPNVPVLRVDTLEEYVNAHIRRERMIAFLSAFFGLLALGLASVGLYGVMAYAVTQRTREVGVRMALGAHRGDVVRLIVLESAIPAAIGITIGLAGSLVLARFVASLLYGVAPRDPGSMIFATVAMLLVALAAAALPARRASRLDPMTALRYE